MRAGARCPTCWISAIASSRFCQIGSSSAASAPTTSIAIGSRICQCATPDAAGTPVFGQQVDPRRGGGRRRVDRDADHAGAEAFGVPQNRVDEHAPRRGEVDAQRVVRAVAIDDDRIEVELLGLERRVPVEIVGERLMQVSSSAIGSVSVLRSDARGDSVTMIGAGAPFAARTSGASAARPAAATACASPSSAIRATLLICIRPFVDGRHSVALLPSNASTGRARRRSRAVRKRAGIAAASSRSHQRPKPVRPNRRARRFG